VRCHAGHLEEVCLALVHHPKGALLAHLAVVPQPLLPQQDVLWVSRMRNEPSLAAESAEEADGRLREVLVLGAGLALDPSVENRLVVEPVL